MQGRGNGVLWRKTEDRGRGIKEDRDRWNARKRLKRTVSQREEGAEEREGRKEETEGRQVDD